MIAGKERKIHFFAMDLPHSDACLVQAYPAEASEAFCARHTAYHGGKYRMVGHLAYLSAVDEAWVGEVDYATLVKLYGGDPASKPETRYGPAKEAPKAYSKAHKGVRLLTADVQALVQFDCSRADTFSMRAHE